MKVHIAFDMCDGHGTCVDACPEVFYLGENDDVVTLLDQAPPAGLREKLTRAALVCPKAAIVIAD